MARRKSNKPMPKELLATFASTHRLNAALRKAGLPKARTLGGLIRLAADGDEQAAAELDAKFPEWREIAERARVAADENDEW